MGRETGISWTSATWNPIRGCTPVSPGCKNCYAASVAKRFSGPGGPYEGLVRINAAGERTDDWNGKIKFVKKHLLDPMKWKKPLMIFVNSMSDLFHDNVTDDMRDQIFAVMALCPQHTFQILTKRPERMLEYMNERWEPAKEQRIGNVVIPAEVVGEDRYCQVERRADGILEELGLTDPAKPALWNQDGSLKAMDFAWPLPNVWLGVSVENQKAADDRLDYLCELACSGWQTMVSFEPLLGPVDPGSWWLSLGPKTWAIVGGESGHGARPMHPDWARSLRDQCLAAGVPFFFKEWGEWIPWQPDGGLSEWKSQAGKLMDRHGFPDFKDANVRGWTADLIYEGSENAVHERVGKKAAGDLLDGVQWHQFPEVK